MRMGVEGLGSFFSFIFQGGLGRGFCVPMRHGTGLFRPSRVGVAGQGA